MAKKSATKVRPRKPIKQPTIASRKLDEIKWAIRQFKLLQNKFIKFGACDTEPDGWFQLAIWNAFDRDKVEIPITGEGWQLFYDMKGCSKAANELFNACLEVVKLVVNFPNKRNKEFVDFINEYCWRV